MIIFEFGELASVTSTFVSDEMAWEQSLYSSIPEG